MDSGKEAEKKKGGDGGDDSPITKSELKDEMRSMIQGLLEMGLIGPGRHVNSN